MPAESRIVPGLQPDGTALALVIRQTRCPP
jgi:hypothetical protein